MRQYKKLFGAFFCLAVVIFMVGRHCQAQSNSSGSDAIGVRIVPNPSHYSIYRWYDSQGFKGSPQALTVDGYEAIRDGRTVYVNAANINTTTKTIYTNIYLISYNQDPAAKTVDVLGQIISHWKFNSNLELAEGAPLPTCAISSLSCTADADCGAGQACATSTAAAGSCVLRTSKNCLTDGDCPNNFFCNSIKAKVVRDLKRVGKLEELNESLFNYKTLNNHYPLLSAGSYLTNHTVSVWPSWTQNFLADLTIAKNFLDPVNRLGNCPGYDPKTCWDKDNKKFVYNPAPNYLMLPAGSYAFVYKTDANGSNYNICAVMESRDPALGYHFSPNDPVGSACVTATGVFSGGQASNTAPILIDKYLTGEAGQEFNGFLKVVDQEGNPLSWSLLTSTTSWIGWKNNGLPNQAPVIKDTNNPNQKKVYAQEAGSAGVYNTILSVSDGQGGVMSTSAPITIVNSIPFIEAADGEFLLDPLIPFGYTFSFSGKNFTTPQSAYSLTKLSGPFDLLNSPILVKTFSSGGINRYQVNFKGLIPTSYQFISDTDFVYSLKVTDRFNASSTKQFRIRFLVEAPQLNFNCPTSARLDKPYSCLIGKTSQGNHSLVFSSGSLPAGLSLAVEGDGNVATGIGNKTFSTVNDIFHSLASLVYQASPAGAAPVGGNSPVIPLAVSGEVYLKGTPTALSNGFAIDIKATNEYQTFSNRSFILKINNYCGDGQKQMPNLEERGGVYNDGYEDCDGTQGVTTNPSASGPALQYGCATDVGVTTPYPIVSNNHCIFKSPVDGGGYCGDGICQSAIETINNCSDDCAQSDPTCTPDCNEKDCGSDGCGGICGTCPTGQECSANKCIQNSCGNGICQPIIGENCLSCTQDCVCPSNAPTCNSSGQCVANPPSCNAPNNCKICNGADCLCDPYTQLCKEGLCYYKSSCKCNPQDPTSIMEVCLAPNHANDTCCNANNETCCGGVCQSDPNHLKETCGYQCCTKASQTCCGNTTCRNNSSLTQCGSEYCCPGQICCGGAYCARPKDCMN